jgi:hypothetical protein
VTYRNRTLTLAWCVQRGSKGHATTEVKIALLKAVATLIPFSTEVGVMGDTELQDMPLLRWLCRRGWHFVIRQQGRLKVRPGGAQWRRISSFDLSEGQTRVVGWVRLTEQHNAGWFWLVLHWAPGEDKPWYLIPDRPGRGYNLGQICQGSRGLMPALPPSKLFYVATWKSL